MTKARGRIYRQRKLEQLPFVIECSIPSGGLRQRLDEMDAWARAKCGNDRYMTTSREEPSAVGTPCQILRVHFAAETRRHSR